jgi:hypothetical protein
MHKPVLTRKFVRFLKCLQIVQIRHGKGDHTIFDRVGDSLCRSIPLRLNYSEVPPVHIQTTLFTIRQSGIYKEAIIRCAEKAGIKGAIA